MREGNAEAESVLARAVDASRAAFGRRLLAAYALGSLAHGGFSALVSDIDLGLVVDDPLRDGDGETIAAVAASAKTGSVEPADRLSVFWATPSILRGDRPGGRFPPLDRLDLLEHGRLLTGTDLRAGLPRPSGDELLVAGARFALDLLAGTPQATGGELLALGVRDATKRVLFPVRFLFTAATGRVGTNHAAAAWYLADPARPSAQLVAAALAWRADPPSPDGPAEALLDQQLTPLYAHYLEDQITHLTGSGATDLAGAFEQWYGRLLAGSQGPSGGPAATGSPAATHPL